MKTTPIEVPIPDWAKCVAQDRDGSWWAYEITPKPEREDRWNAHHGKHEFIANSAPNPNWRETLRRV